MKIYRAGTGTGELSEDSILQLTPPSKPMGIRVLECDSLPNIGGYLKIKLRWFHNMEPDMERAIPNEEIFFKKYRIFRNTASDMESIPPDAMQYPENYYELIDSVDVNENNIPEYIDSVLVSNCNDQV